MPKPLFYVGTAFCVFLALSAAATLTQQILREYPTRDPMMNRELVKLLAYLKPPGAAHALTHQ